MKTNFEDLKRLNETEVPLNDKSLFLSDNPIDNILEDLKELRFYCQLNDCNTKESLIKWLKTVRYMEINNSIISTEPIIFNIENFLEAPDYSLLKKIPKEFGIRSKATELFFAERFSNIKGGQMKMKL